MTDTRVGCKLVKYDSNNVDAALLFIQIGIRVGEIAKISYIIII